MYWAERYASLGKLVRYADDFVIICRTKQEAETALQKVKQIMAILKLTLHPTKTRVVDMGQDGFDFLGFHFHKKKAKKSGKLLPYIWPSQKAMKAVRSKIHYITRKKAIEQSAFRSDKIPQPGHSWLAKLLSHWELHLEIPAT